MEEPFERPSSRSRKRRSLNLSLDFSQVLQPTSSRPSLNKHSHTGSDVSGGASYEQVGSEWDYNNVITRRKGLASPGTSSKRSSFQAVLEQEKLIQQQLQDIARSENARLSPNSSVADLSIPLGGDMSPIQRAVTPFNLHSPVTSPTLGGATTFGTSSSLPSSSHATVKRTVSKNKKKPASNQSDKVNVFMMSPEDLERLQRAACIIADSPVFSEELLSSPIPTSGREKQREEPIAKKIAGPVRPVNINGEVLSWQMAGNILNMTSSKRELQYPQQSLLTRPSQPPSTLGDAIKYFWSIFTRPENFKGSLSKFELLPPKEVVDSVKSSIPSALGVKDFLIKLLLLVISVSIVTIQILLLGVMVFVYTVGDIIIYPVRKIRKARTTPEDLTKRKIQKLRRKARAAS